MNQKTQKLPKDNHKINFKEYRILATAGDIEMMKKNLKPHIWENIPFIGCLCYIIRMTLKNSNIDRGPLRREMVKYRLILMASTLLIWGDLILFVTPWLLYLPIKLAVNKVQSQLDNNEI